MRKHLSRMVLLSFMGFLLQSAQRDFAQSGGPFQLTQSVIASGGSDSSGTNFGITGTVGQPTTSESANGSFSLRGGFWSASFAPTAAGVSIGGQIRTADGAGIRNVRITLTHLATGETTSALSSTFGYYRFDDLTVGRLYVLSVGAKQFVFEPNTRVISLLDELTNEDFIANPK